MAVQFCNGPGDEAVERSAAWRCGLDPASSLGILEEGTTSRVASDPPDALRARQCLSFGPQGYESECHAGWEGTNCQHEIDECASQPCANDATCVDLLAGYR